MTGKKKSVLMTPDPYHTPGYGGFCPQFKYQIGETFGRTTSRLLTDPTVASSGHLVLGDTTPITAEGDPSLEGKRALLRSRTRSWGNQKLVERMVPGYTGFIPKSQHYFGKRYAANCVNAISNFESDQCTHATKIQDLRNCEALQSGRMAPVDGLPKISSKYQTPLQAIIKEPKLFISASTPHHTMSPYYMSNGNNDKRFMSGYTGFVPRARGLIGQGYPLITHMALNEFTDDLQRYEHLSTHPIDVHRRIVAKINSRPIYPTESGLVPHYTGHIPGEKFRYGQTFGHSTKNAKPLVGSVA